MVTLFYRACNSSKIEEFSGMSSEVDSRILDARNKVETVDERTGNVTITYEDRDWDMHYVQGQGAE